MQRDYALAEMHHVRLAARDGLKGNSPVMDVAEAIALEIAAGNPAARFSQVEVRPILHEAGVGM